MSLHGEPTMPPAPTSCGRTNGLLGQRYLLHEANPPVSRRQAADQLAELRPDADWTVKGSSTR